MNIGEKYRRIMFGTLVADYFKIHRINMVTDSIDTLVYDLDGEFTHQEVFDSLSFSTLIAVNEIQKIDEFPWEKDADQDWWDDLRQKCKEITEKNKEWK